MDNRFSVFTVSENESMIDALGKIDKNTQGVVIVVNDDETVLGVLTDGDIRRSIIKGSIDADSISTLYNKECKDSKHFR